MSKPLKDWELSDLIAFLYKNEIEVYEAIVLIGTGACEMHRMAVENECTELAAHYKKILLNYLDKTLDSVL